MDKQTRDDLKDIFATLPQDLLDQLIELLSSVETNTIRVKTRGNNKLPLQDKLHHIRYFTAVRTKRTRTKSVIFAGAYDHPNHESVSAIRFGGNNPCLADVPGEFKFAYWQRLTTNDINIILNPETVGMFPQLFKSEIELNE